MNPMLHSCQLSLLISQNFGQDLALMLSFTHHKETHPCLISFTGLHVVRMIALLWGRTKSFSFFKVLSNRALYCACNRTQNKFDTVRIDTILRYSGSKYQFTIGLAVCACVIDYSLNVTFGCTLEWISQDLKLTCLCFPLRGRNVYDFYTLMKPKAKPKQACEKLKLLSKKKELPLFRLLCAARINSG